MPRVVTWRPVRLPRRAREAGARLRPRATRSTRKQSRTASSKKKPTRKPAARRGQGARRPRNRRPAPRAVRTGRGPIARFFDTVFRGVAAVWLAVAHGIGAVARGHRPRRPRARARAPPRRCRPLHVRAVGHQRGRGLVPARRSGHGRGPRRRHRLRRQGRLAGAADAARRRLAQPARPDPQRPGRPAGRRLERARPGAARHRAHRRGQPAAGLRRCRPAPRGWRRRRLRRLLPPPRPAAHAVRRGAGPAAPLRLRRPGHHRHSALPGAVAAGRGPRPGPGPRARPRTTRPPPGRRAAAGGVPISMPPARSTR